MASRVFMTGNDAMGEAAVKAGCGCYYGYPITPQNELTAYMARRMEESRRVFIQAESEMAAINMVFGSSLAGKRAMTSSSSPGISLKQEGISYLAGAELPAVIINVQRGGPGLGNIDPAQGDYFQATRGGGHGDYRQIVLGPDSVQEMHDFTYDAFRLAEKYRMPVMVLADGRLGQMMEPLVLKEDPLPPPDNGTWALTGAKGRPPRLIRSLYLGEGELEALNLRLQEKYREIERKEIRWEEQATDDCDVLMVAYGTSARICAGALKTARDSGLKAGLLRPVTLWPFPASAVSELSERVRKILVVEMSAGQMLEDVQLAVRGRKPVDFTGRMGGLVPSEDDVLRKLKETQE
ncbi:MAG: 3-methyl-2-oxobutanoate dehydrogenase subunit VorB [Kiritimatiellia bacterium]